MKGGAIGVTEIRSTLMKSLLLAFKLPTLLMSCVGTDCMEPIVNVSEGRRVSNSPVATMAWNVTRDTQLRFRLLKVVTQHFVQHGIPITDDAIKENIVEIVMIVLQLKSKNASNSIIRGKLEQMMESIDSVQQAHNLRSNANSFEQYVKQETELLKTELSMLKTLLSTPPSSGRNNSRTSSTNSWSSYGANAMNTSAITEKIAVIESMIKAFNNNPVNVYVSLVKAAKAIVSNCMYTFVGNPGGSTATKSEELKDEFKIGLVSKKNDITEHIRTVLEHTKTNLETNDVFAANLLNGIITAEITYTRSDPVAQAPRVTPQNALQAQNAVLNDNFNTLSLNNDGYDYQHANEKVGVKWHDNALYEGVLKIGDEEFMLYTVWQEGIKAGGGKYVEKVKVLGRTRKVIKEGRRKFVIVKGVKMALVDARKAEKEIARAKKN